jgi:glyceraldehyde-3-phosphate dehydrogenase (ferredoxin)
MESHQKVLFVDAGTAFYRINRFTVGENFFGPIDLGLHLASRYKSLNIGTGLLAGSIFPGSNRLFFNGFSPCWTGFYISSMGGAGLVFDNLGVNMISIVNRTPTPSILYLNRKSGEEIEVKIQPVQLWKVWKEGRFGIYSLMDYTFERFREYYSNDPRILAVGPASAATDFGASASVPISKGKLGYADTWAGRGGFGTKLLKEHGIAAIIYGGTFIDEDFRDRKVADQWFINKYQKKLAAKDLEATTKYRFDPDFQTGGTFGANYAVLAGNMVSFNYRSVFMSEDERLDIHDKFILKHYLKQFRRFKQ